MRKVYTFSKRALGRGLVCVSLGLAAFGLHACVAQKPLSLRGGIAKRPHAQAWLCPHFFPTFAQNSTHHGCTNTQIQIQKAQNQQGEETSTEASSVDPTREPCDPFYLYNKGIFIFNKAMDRLLFRPLIETYRAIPSPVRKGIVNILRILESPVYMVTSWISQDIEALKENVLFPVMNIFLGFGGLRNTYKVTFHKNPKRITFVDILKKTRLPTGCYFMLPLLGPCTFRDGMGRVLDCLGQPLTYWGRGADLYYGLTYWHLKMSYVQTMRLFEGIGDEYAALRRVCYDISQHQENLDAA